MKRRRTPTTKYSIKNRKSFAASRKFSPMERVAAPPKDTTKSSNVKSTSRRNRIRGTITSDRNEDFCAKGTPFSPTLQVLNLDELSVYTKLLQVFGHEQSTSCIFLGHSWSTRHSMSCKVHVLWWAIRRRKHCCIHKRAKNYKNCFSTSPPTSAVAY